MTACITLTTDFGTRDSYVGAIKGVLLSICPDAQVIDICHDIPPQDIRAGALRLAAATRYFPPGSVHLAVVDPGVGSPRRAIAVENERHRFVGPDNGLLFLALRQSGGPWRSVELTDPHFWLTPVSQTFHGRDVFAPVAAHLAMGTSLARLGRPADPILELAVAEPRWIGDCLHGEIIDIDRFGNLISNITADHLRGFAWSSIKIRGHAVPGLSHHYDPERKLVALVSSEERLEIASPAQSAAASYGIGVGEPIEVCHGEQQSPS